MMLTSRRPIGEVVAVAITTVAATAAAMIADVASDKNTLAMVSER